MCLLHRLLRAHTRQAPQQEQEHEDDLDRYYSASDSSSETGDGAEDLTEGELQQLVSARWGTLTYRWVTLRTLAG